MTMTRRHQFLRQVYKVIMKRSFFILLAAWAATITVWVSTMLTHSISSSSTLSTTPGIKTAQWGSNVTISYTDSSFTFVSDGIPNHARQAEYIVPKDGVIIPTPDTAHTVADPTVAQNYSFSIPLLPTKSATPTPTNLGAIGVMISGAVLYNPYEADNKTVAKLSNFTVKNANGREVSFLDSCNGHPTPIGQYHYHALPTCITSVVDGQSGPSHIIGVAFDGFPIYGDQAMDGSKITASQLDFCNGITSATPEFPNGIYHYVLLDTKDSTSSIRCFTGKVSTNLVSFIKKTKMPGMMSMQHTSNHV